MNSTNKETAIAQAYEQFGVAYVPPSGECGENHPMEMRNRRKVMTGTGPERVPDWLMAEFLQPYFGQIEGKDEPAD